MSESYGAFAYAYDQSLGRSFFAAVRRVLDDVLYKYPSRGKSHLDVACGTGLAIEHLRKQGFDSIGVDASLSMLSIARRHTSSPAISGRSRCAGSSRGSPASTTASITC